MSTKRNCKDLIPAAIRAVGHEYADLTNDHRQTSGVVTLRLPADRRVNAVLKAALSILVECTSLQVTYRRGK